MMAYLVGVDIGGTKIAFGIGTPDGKLAAVERFSTRHYASGIDALSAVAERVHAMRRDLGIAPRELVAAGVGSPGPLLGSRLGRSANLPGWEGTDLRAGLQALNCPVFVQNDATAAAIGEWRFGAGQGCRDMVYVTVSTGIGSGLILEGRPYAGVDGNAGELGHLVMKPDGPRCHCGRSGCLEQLASGTAIARRGQERLTDSPYLSRLSAVTTADVFGGAAAGDPVCAEIIADAARYLGLGVSYLIDLLNPERIVFGGGVMGAGTVFLQQIAEQAACFTLPDLFRGTELQPAGLGEHSGVLGAVAVAATESEGQGADG